MRGKRGEVWRKREGSKKREEYRGKVKSIRKMERDIEVASFC